MDGLVIRGAQLAQHRIKWSSRRLIVCSPSPLRLGITVRNSSSSPRHPSSAWQRPTALVPGRFSLHGRASAGRTTLPLPTFAPEPRHDWLGTLWVVAGKPGNPGRADCAEELGTVMKARVGDRLLPDGEQRRAGVIIGLRNADGSPPYVVKWLSDGHIALVFPGPYTKVVPGAPANGAALPAETPA
jgi:Domain of unknown function (DUF1918)